MSETDINTQNQKPRTCGLAIASLVLGIFALVLLLLQDLSIRRCPPSTPTEFLVLAIPGLVLGIAALFKINKSKRRLTGGVSAIFGIIINGFLIFGLVYGFRYDYTRREFYRRAYCGANLHSLGIAVVIYANENDDIYPTTDKWCDLITQYTRPKRFACKSALVRGDKGRCHYAMNPNAKPNSPQDMVLMFETKGGWNQVGGPELLTTENHKGKGCNILFNDTHVKFVKTKQLVELKWEVEEGNNGGKGFFK